MYKHEQKLFLIQILIIIKVNNVLGSVLKCYTYLLDILNIINIWKP